jgi:hypothetical protein
MLNYLKIKRPKYYIKLSNYLELFYANLFINFTFLLNIVLLILTLYFIIVNIIISFLRILIRLNFRTVTLGLVKLIRPIRSSGKTLG